MSEFLFEIGTEEIPAGYIQPALNFFAAGAEKKLQGLQLDFNGIRTYGTPRRLTLAIDFLQSKQPDQRLEHIGPAKKAAFDADGNPTKAAQGFARSRNVDVSALQVIETPKGEYLMAVEDVAGRETVELLPELLEELVREVVFPKSMRWANTSMAFCRPIQWLLALYDGKPVDIQLESVQSGVTTRGHRFMAPDMITITGTEHYIQALEKSFVIVDPVRRRKMVIDEVERAVSGKIGDRGTPVLDEGLLDTVTNLVETPCGICGEFDEKFLQLPKEALVTSMREHQKYFPVIDKDGKLLPLFVAINNTVIDDLALAASGHERVLRARLEDGLFFFNEDKKYKLDQRYDDLKGIIFQYKLGSMLDKCNRLEKLAALLALKVEGVSSENAQRGARLAKVDLLTEMVGEFPSLQGIMGREYALLDGEKPEVAQAIHEHYMPVRAGSDLPTSALGGIVGIADRLDTLAGCFIIGERPTGNKDAFGLRRQAIGLINIIRGLDLSLSLSECVNAALDGYRGAIEIPSASAEEILAFIGRRFANEQIAQGQPQEVVEAAISVGFDNITDCMARIQALHAMMHQEQFGVLAGSFKRIRNIIKDNRTTEVDPEHFTDEAERSLFSAMAGVRDRALPKIWDRDYDGALREMLAMKEPVDVFFDKVMVMADDPVIRQNRLNLLTGLGELVLQIGDISKMHVE